MKTYKITNITNLFGKRDRYYNTVVNIDYIDNRISKSKLLKGGESMYLTTQLLSLSTHRLRLKKFIIIEDSSLLEVNNSFVEGKDDSKVVKKVKPSSTSKKGVNRRRNKNLISKDDLDIK